MMPKQLRLGNNQQEIGGVLLVLIPALKYTGWPYTHDAKQVKGEMVI